MSRNRAKGERDLEMADRWKIDFRAPVSQGKLAKPQQTGSISTAPTSVRSMIAYAFILRRMPSGDRSQ